MNKGAPPDSLCLVRKVRFFPAPPEILKRRSITPVSGALAVVALDPWSSGGALAKCRRGRLRWAWPAARGCRRWCAGQVPTQQGAVGMASSARRPLAAGWPGPGAAGGGGPGPRVAATTGPLAGCPCCRLRWTWSAARCGRSRCAGLAPVLLGAVIEIYSLRRWPVRLPACSKRDDLTARAYRAAEDRKKGRRADATTTKLLQHVGKAQCLCGSPACRVRR